MTDRLFPLDDIPEIPLLPTMRRSRGAQISDERLGHDYPPEWHRCTTCGGTGERREAKTSATGESASRPREIGPLGGEMPTTTRYPCDPRSARGLPSSDRCPACLGMGSVKARVRLEAHHRCARCGHPYMPKGDARMLGVEPTPYRWSPCDRTTCQHGGPRRSWIIGEDDDWVYEEQRGLLPKAKFWRPDVKVEAEWRILTVHHLDGDKANLAWWNLAALCQRCHLEIQAKVVLERVYPHEHSEWFKPYAAGWYAHAYLGESLSRDETLARLDELLALERAA